MSVYVERAKKTFNDPISIWASDNWCPGWQWHWPLSSPLARDVLPRLPATENLKNIHFFIHDRFHTGPVSSSISKVASSATDKVPQCAGAWCLAWSWWRWWCSCWGCRCRPSPRWTRTWCRSAATERALSRPDTRERGQILRGWIEISTNIITALTRGNREVCCEQIVRSPRVMKICLRSTTPLLHILLSTHVKTIHKLKL